MVQYSWDILTKVVSYCHYNTAPAQGQPLLTKLTQEIFWRNTRPGNIDRRYLPGYNGRKPPFGEAYD
jgi:hypothetical protein